MTATSSRPAPSAAPKSANVPLVYLDGQWLDRDTAKVSVYDHGLLYGDGVFEGMRVYNGKTFKLKEHVDRLYDSAQAILLNPGMSKAEMIALTEEGIKRWGQQDGYLRHIITRGVGDLGLDPRKCPKASIIIIFDAIAIWPAERYEVGLTLITAGTPINHREALSARVKSLNYLNHIMAKVEATNAQVDDAIMLDASGHVAEASGMNIFVYKNGVLSTPALYAGLLRGVTRDTVLDIAREAGIKVQETMLNRYDIYTADEAFLTGSAAEVAPIRMVDGRVIGAGKAGPITKDIRARFQKLVRS
ncbi:MAG TPA: branched-chain-amino-acid transaminase [Gemmatimonadales bacterium]|nr:branched-chain-amino-acid transaminase [Gemmatimonadales bacterium]